MDLFDRYLQAVGQHLPARGREDTLAELRANLLAEIESREEDLHRPLAEPELAAILERHGTPIAVAARYWPRQALIGPELFPVYLLTLKKSLPFVVLAYLAVQAATFLAQGERFSVGALVGHFPGALLTFWSVMTLGFAVFELMDGRYFPKLKLTGRWNPDDLPPLRSADKQPSLAGGPADLIVQVLLVGWLLLIPNRPYLLLGPGLAMVRELPVGLTPEWPLLYWQIVGLMALGVPLKAMVLLRSMRPWRREVQLATQLIGVLVLVVLVQSRSYFVPKAAMATDTAASLATTNALIHAGFELGLVVSVLKLLWDGWKVIREPRLPRAGCALV